MAAAAGSTRSLAAASASCSPIAASPSSSSSSGRNSAKGACFLKRKSKDGQKALSRTSTGRWVGFQAQLQRSSSFSFDARRCSFAASPDGFSGSKCRQFSPFTAELASSAASDMTAEADVLPQTEARVAALDSRTNSAHGTPDGRHNAGSPLGLASIGPGLVSFQRGLGMLQFIREARNGNSHQAVASGDLSEPPPAGLQLSKPEPGVAGPGPGVVSFAGGSGSAAFRAVRQEDSSAGPSTSSKAENGLRKELMWLLGPLALVIATIFPPAILRPLFEAIFGNSSESDLLAIIGTDISFVVSACFFLFWSHTRGLHTNTDMAGVPWERPWRHAALPIGYKEWRASLWFLGVCLPIFATLLSTQFYVGTLAAAVLLPPVAMFFVQAGLERLSVTYQSPMAPLIALIFDGYRLHQLNRAAGIVSSAFKSLQPLSTTPESTPVYLAACCLHWVWVVVQVLGAVWLGNAAINMSCLPWLFSSWRPKEAEAAPA